MHRCNSIVQLKHSQQFFLTLTTSFQQISPLHLACQRGHVEVVNLLLEWKADVSFRSIDDRNALDYAIDFGQRSCVLTLIKHKTWNESLKNAYVDSVSGLYCTSKSNA